MDDGPQDERWLLEGYWRYAHEIRSPDRALRLVHEAGTSQASRAHDRVRALVEAQGPCVLPLLVGLALSAPDEDSLAFFAAGPLEDWMGRTGEDDLARAAVEARREPRFREAAEHVVLSEQRHRLWERLVVGTADTGALGSPLHRGR